MSEADAVIKQGIRDLALFGGAPVFSESLHVGRPNAGNRDALLERINNRLDTYRHLTVC